MHPEGSPPADGGPTAEPTEGHGDQEIPTAFVEEVRAAFLRLRPQGNTQWNFSDAFARLEREFGSLVERSPLSDPPGGGGPTLGTSRSPLKRALESRQRPTSDESFEARAQSGFDATLEAFRYLEIRVAELEEALRRRAAPIEGIAAIVEPPDLAPWIETICSWLGPRVLDARCVHAECGTGELASALVRRGTATIGIEPRGDRALLASQAGVTVHLQDARAYLASVEPHSIGGLVLSGVTDRLGVEEHLSLLAIVTQSLMLDAPLVVVGTDPEIVTRTWSPEARDLVTGRPLHIETWALLLRRHGFSDVGALRASSTTPSYAIGGCAGS